MSGHVVETDVLIVGSGHVAWRLHEAPDDWEGALSDALAQVLRPDPDGQAATGTSPSRRAFAT